MCSEVSGMRNSVEVHVTGRPCSSWDILALCCMSCYSHYCSSPVSYESRDETFWHWEPLLQRLFLSLRTCAPGRLCMYVLAAFLMFTLGAPWHCVPLRPRAAQWLRLAWQTPILSGKWSVHNLCQWYLWVSERLLFPPSHLSFPLHLCAFLTPPHPSPVYST